MFEYTRGRNRSCKTGPQSDYQYMDLSEIFVLMEPEIKSFNAHERNKFLKPNNNPVNDLKNLARGALLSFVGLYHLQSLCSRSIARPSREPWDFRASSGYGCFLILRAGIVVCQNAPRRLSLVTPRQRLNSSLSMTVL